MKKLFILIAFICALLQTEAQDIHFSQQKFAPLLLNPATGGANYDNQATLAYRDQWKSVNARFVTMYAGYDMRIQNKKSKSGFFAAGINFYSDKAGSPELVKNEVQLALAYHIIPSPHHTIGIGIQPSYTSTLLRDTDFGWGLQYDGQAYNSALPTGETGTLLNKKYFDLNSGVLYTYKSSEHYMTANDELAINAGISVNHLLRPDVSFYGSGADKIQMRINSFANALIGIPNTKFSFMPAVYFSMQGNQKDIVFGTYYRYLLQDHSVYTGIKKGSAFSFGTFYRTGDAFLAKVLLEYSHYAVGFCYDMNVSSYTTATKGRGGFEIVLRYVSPNPFGHTVGKSRI